MLYFGLQVPTFSQVLIIARTRNVTKEAFRFYAYLLALHVSKELGRGAKNSDLAGLVRMDYLSSKIGCVLRIVRPLWKQKITKC